MSLRRAPPLALFVKSRQDLGDSGIELVAWPFVEAAVYALLQAEIREQVKKAYDEAGIMIPKPQQDAISILIIRTKFQNKIDLRVK